MKLLLQQKPLFSNLLTGKTNLPSLYYSSLRPPSVRDKPNDYFPYTGPRGAPLKVKAKRGPFLKNILVGTVDMEMLVYPEVLDIDRLKNIDQMSDFLNRYWIEEVCSDQNYFSKKEDFFKALSNYGLSKQKIPYSHNGLDLTSTESVKICEILGKNSVSFNHLSSQNVIQEILGMATEAIKESYYEGIVERNWIGAICSSENHAEFDIQKCNTKVSWSDSVKSNVLNGQKLWVAGADTADFFVVTGHFNGPTICFVDKNKLGITIKEHQEPGYFIVEFKDTPVGDNIVTDGAKSLEIFSKIQASGMLYYSSAMVGIVKDVFDLTTQYVLYRPFLQKYCSDFESTQVLLSKAASKIYALEAMLYLTTGLIDGYDGQDYEIEVAVLKVFASQVSQSVIGDCIDLLGPHIVMHSHPYPFLKTLASVKRLSHLHTSDDLLKNFVAIKCIEYNKPSLSTYYGKVKSPFIHIREIVKHNMFLANHKNDVVALDLKVHNYVHPSLKHCADILEFCIKRLEFVNLVLLETYGVETFDHQYHLIKMTNILCEIFAMASTVSRASRSYCTGIKNSDMEMVMAALYCESAKRRVAKIVDEIKILDQDPSIVCAKKTFEDFKNSKGYCIRHPLVRNV